MPSRGPVVQSLKVRQIDFRRSFVPLSTSAGRSGYDSTIRPRPTKSVRPFAHRVLRHVRQPLLQIAVGRSDHHQVREALLQPRRGLDLPGDAAQRILRRQVAVERRKQRRPLGVRVVVRAPAGDADPLHVHLLQRRQQLHRRRRSTPDRRASGRSRDSRRPASGIGLADAVFAFPVRHEIEDGYSHARSAGRAPRRAPPR